MRPSISFVNNMFPNQNLIGAEIGVREGKHALIMLEGLKLERLYLIDLWTSYICENKSYDYTYLYEQIKKKFKDYNNITIIKGTSVGVSFQFENNFFDFVYIDANHQYEYVKEDVNAWYSKIKKRGYLCGHDYTPLCPGVIKAVDEFVKENKLQLYVNDTDWWLKKE